jgi:hypothetical protein
LCYKLNFNNIFAGYMASGRRRKRKNGGFFSGWTPPFDPTIHPLPVAGKECVPPHVPKLPERFGAV